MEVVDCQSFLLLKKQITDTDELITKCQFLQSQLEMVQKERAKQQVELKVMENENAMLLSAKRKYESEFHQKMGVLKGYENSIKQYTAKINEYEKIHDRNMATIKTLQAERDTAVSENRKVSSHRSRSLKARSKQTQTELLVQMDDNSKIIIPSFSLTCRQRRRRSSQAVAKSTNSETTQLVCKTPTVMLTPAERASTPKSSCSEEDNSDGEDITEREMPWLTEITEQPLEHSLCDVTYSESELDDPSDGLLLPSNAMDVSISPLPPTPSMRMDEVTESIDTSKDMSTHSDHYASDDSLPKESHLSSELIVVPDDDNEKIEESTLISSHQLSDDSDNVVVTTGSANLLLEKATGLQESSPAIQQSSVTVQQSSVLTIESSESRHESRHESLTMLGAESCNEEVYKSPTLCSPQSASLPTSTAMESSNLDVLKSPKPLVLLSSNKQSDNVPTFVSHVPAGLTSPVALRSVSNAFGKGTKDKKTYPSFIVDSHRKSPVTTGFKKHHITKKKIGNLNRQLSPQFQTYFPSIAERTRSQSSRYNYDTLPIPKQAERELSKLEITMNSPSRKAENIQNEQSHEMVTKQIGNRFKKGSRKRKRRQRQPRSDPKKKRFNANTYQRHHKAGNCDYSISDELFDQPTQLVDRASSSYESYKQTNESENKENGRNSNKSGREIVDFDKSEGELDSSNEYRSEGELGNSPDGEIPDEMKEVFDEIKNGVHVDRNGSDKSQGNNCKEHGREDGVISTRNKKSGSKIIEEDHGGNLDKDKEDCEDKCERQLNKGHSREEVKNTKKVLQEGKYKQQVTESESKVENGNEKLENKNKMETDESCEVESLDKKSGEGKSGGEVLQVKGESNKEEMLETNDRGELKESRNEIDDKEEKLEEAKELEDKEVVDNTEEKSEENKERELDNVELSEVENEEEMLEDKKEGELNKNNENKSDGELDSEEDEPPNQIPQSTMQLRQTTVQLQQATVQLPKELPQTTMLLPQAEMDNTPGTNHSLIMKSKSTDEIPQTGTSCVDEDTLESPCKFLKETHLPGWLEWMINEEEKTSNTLQHSFIKEQKRKRAKYRHVKNQSQKAMNYLLANLERLLLKTLKFEKVLELFSDPSNIDSSSDFANALTKFIVEALHPSFENIAGKLAERCNKAVSHNAKIFPHYKPLDENFHPVMLTFESRIVAMLMVVEKHNPKLDNVMGCVADTLRCMLFMSLEDNHIDVHKQCSLIRVITAISRVVGKIDFMQRLCLDLISLNRPLKVSQLPLLQAVAGVWPLVLARKEDVKLYGMKEVIPEGLEPQIVSHTVEVTTCYLIAKQDPQEFRHLLFKTFVSFCRWQQLSNEAAMHSLSTALVKLLTSSPNVTLTSYDSTSQGKWIPPQLSAITHMCITCLTVIGKYLGWKWISDNLIREQLWPLLQKWSRKTMGEEVSEAVITAIAQLIGLVGKQGVLHDPTCQSVRQLQKMLSSLLQRAHSSPEVTLSIQLAVAESLISLCHPSQLLAAKEVLQNWLTGIKTHHPYAAHTIMEDFAPRVWTMKATASESTSNEKTY